MNTLGMLLLHHWRRTWAILLLPVLLSAAWTITLSVDIYRSTSKSIAWATFETSIVGKTYILVVGALCAVMALGSGETNAAMPNYAKTLPVSDRRWSLSYIIYSLLVFGILAVAITITDWRVEHATTERLARVEVERGQPWGKSAMEAREKAAFESAPTSQSAEAGHLKAPSEAPFRRTPSAEEALRAWRGRLQENPQWQRERFVRAAPKRSERAPTEAQFWKEPLGFISIVLFCQSVFLILTLIPRTTIRVFTQALALAALPTAAIGLSISWEYDWRAVALWLWMLAIGVALTHAAVTTTRHGKQLSPRRLVETVTGAERSREFVSPKQALAWYDWMTFARYLLYGSAGLGVVMSLYAISEGINRPMVSGFAVVPAAGLAGLYLAYRLYHGDRQDNDAYLITLPVTVERLSQCRLATVVKAVLAAWVVGLGIEAFVSTAYFVLAGESPIGWRAMPEVSSIFYIALVAAWVLIWMTGPLFYPVVGLWLLWATFYAVHAEEIATYIGLIILAVLLIAAAVWLVRLAKRRELLAGWNKRGAVLATLLSAAIVMPVLLYARDLDAPDELAYVVGLVMCLLAAVPFIALPLAIDRYRHR